MKRLILTIVLCIGFSTTAFAALPPQPILGYWVLVGGFVETFFPDPTPFTFAVVHIDPQGDDR